MRLYRKPHIISLSLIILSLMCAGALSQDVMHAPSEHKTLAQRLDWARSVVETDPSFVNGYWIGYTIDKYMHENARMGRSGYSDRDIPTLQNLLLGTGRAGPEVVQERKILTAAQEELQTASSDKAERKKVLKKVAILFSYPSFDANMTDFNKVNMATLDGLVDLEGRPLLWLDSVEDALIRIAKSEKDQAIQKEAIFWLGQKASKKAMDSVEEIAFDAEHTELQKQAVFAISQWSKDQSIPALSKISRDHSNPEVRKQAIFWLGQTGDPRAVDTLAEIVKGSR